MLLGWVEECSFFQLIIDIDFTEYTQKGFLFTPNAYTANYESIGLITIIYYPEARLITKEIEYEGKDKDGNKRTRKESEWVINKINSNANVIGIILSTLWKWYPLNISNIPIKILSIRLWFSSDFKIKTKIIKKDINLTFLCSEKKDRINTVAVRKVSGKLKINRIFVGSS